MTIQLLRRPWRNTPTCGMQISMAGGGRIGAIVGIESRTVHLPVWRSSGGRGWAVPWQQGLWQPPARWSSRVHRGNEPHIARTVVLHNNQHKSKEVKWWRNSSPGGISSAMARVAATMQQSTYKRGGKDKLLVSAGSGSATTQLAASAQQWSRWQGQQQW